MKNKSSRAGKFVKSASATLPSSASSHELQKGPFSRLFRIAELPEQSPETGFNVKITALSEECEALAEDFELPAIERLDAEFQIFRLAEGRFHVDGFVEADVIETCVVSLDLFKSSIKAQIDLDFVEMPKSGTDRARAAEMNFDQGQVLRLDGEQDPPQPIVDGKIDLGAAASEFLALNLDPYPKKPGVKFEPLDEVLEKTKEMSPFEVLRQLKDVK